MAINDKLKNLQTSIGYEFKSAKLLRTALTHKSYAYEMKRTDIDDYNERLEYLGDAILEHIISDILYNIKPAINEGQMTKRRAEIVCEKSFCNAFKAINGNEYIFLGRCEIATGGRNKPAIIADAFEALIGAIYIDSSYDMAKQVALNLLNKTIDNTLQGNTNIVDYKTKLQEILQKDGNIDIEYILTKEEGPDHKKIFYTDVVINGENVASGIGKSRKISEQKAAEVAYAKYN